MMHVSVDPALAEYTAMTILTFSRSVSDTEYVTAASSLTLSDGDYSTANSDIPDVYCDCSFFFFFFLLSPTRFIRATSLIGIYQGVGSHVT